MNLEYVQFEGKKASSAQSRAPRVPYCLQPSPGVPETRDAFLSWVLSQAGVDATHYQCHSLQRRLGASLRAVKVRSSDEARALLESNGDLVVPAVSALLIGVTRFFRNAKVFHTVRHQVLPALAQRRRPLRIWSAGCSTGAELYSVAMLLAEAGLLEHSELLGTDLRCDAIQKAPKGLFDLAVIEHVEPAMREKYFERRADQWQVIQPLRRRTCWRALDLLQEQPPGQWDLILCRNVAIYLSPAVVGRLWERLAGALAPEGFLVVGKAERPSVREGLLPLERCVYRKA